MRRIWFALAAAILVLAGCGDDDSTDTASDTGDTSDDVSEDTSDDGDGGDAAGFLDDSNCNFVLEAGFANPMGGLGAGGSVPDLDEVGDRFQDAADAAPEEIRTEFQLVADRYGTFVELVGDVDFSDPESLQDPDVQESFEEVEQLFDEEFQEAADAVSAYFESNCEV